MSKLKYAIDQYLKSNKKAVTTSSTELFNLVVNITNLYDELNPKLIEYIKNKNVPLKDRWSFYCIFSSFFLPIDGCIYSDLDPILGVEVHGDDLIWWERHQTKDFSSVMETIECSEDPKFTEDQINQCKEKILESGLAGYVCDW